MRHAGVVRLDHVMALHRLWWIPAGSAAGEGAYVHYPAEELAAVVTLEATRAGAVVVGENLGTVPPEVDRLLGEHRLLGMYATQFELDAAPHARRPPAGSMAVVNTHDMAPFAAFWRGRDPGHRDRIRAQLAGDGAATDGPAPVAGRRVTTPSRCSRPCSGGWGPPTPPRWWSAWRTCGASPSPRTCPAPAPRRPTGAGRRP